MADCDCGTCIVDETGALYQTGEDVNGNECVVIPRNPVRKAVTFNSELGETPDSACCELDFHIGGVAIDTAFGCVTHVCAGPEFGWQPICGVNMNPEDEEPECDTVDVCYDLTGFSFPTSFGNSTESWLVNGQNVLAGFECETVPTPSFPGIVEQTCDYSAGNAQPTHPTWENLNWFDTGQAAGAATSIFATGNPADGWACTRPTFRVDFLESSGTGPYAFDTTVTDGSGGLGFGMYDECNGVYLPITGFSTTPTGGSGPIISATINPTNLGDQLFIFTFDQNNNPWTGDIHIDYADPNGVDASCLKMVITAVGNFNGVDDQDDGERLVGTELTFTPEPGEVGECCQSANTVAELNTLLNEVDSESSAWTVRGNRLCTTLTQGQEFAYGSLSFPCSGNSVNPTFEYCDGETVEPEPVPCVMEWCVQDDNGDTFTVTHTEQDDGTFTTTFAPAGPPVGNLLPGEC